MTFGQQNQSNDIISKISLDTKYEENKVINLTEEKDFKILINSSNTTFVRFTAPWCKPCKLLEPIFDSYPKNFTTCKFITVDVDQFDMIAGEYTVVTIPRIIAFRNGAHIATTTSKDESEITKFIIHHQT
jgi:thioredoxin 1